MCVCGGGWGHVESRRANGQLVISLVWYDDVMLCEDCLTSFSFMIPGVSNSQ